MINHIPKSNKELISLCGLSDTLIHLVSFSTIDPTCPQCLAIQAGTKPKGMCEICDGEVNIDIITYEGRVVHKECYHKIIAILETKRQAEIDNIITQARLQKLGRK